MKQPQGNRSWVLCSVKVWFRSIRDLNATVWKNFYATRVKTNVKQNPNSKTLTLTANKVTVQMRLQAWTAALTNSQLHSPQVTAPLRRGATPSSRSRQSQEEERHLQTGHGTLMQVTAPSTEVTASSTEVRAPLISTSKARYPQTQVTSPTGLQQQSNTLKPNCNKMLDWGREFRRLHA